MSARFFWAICLLLTVCFFTSSKQVNYPTLSLQTGETSGYADLKTFINQVKLLESLFPESEQRNTANMATRFRRLFYNSEGWNTYLIQAPDSLHFPAAYQLEKNRLANLFAFNGLMLKDYTSVSKLVNGEHFQPEVKLADGSVADISHVFCALDAHFHPKKVFPIVKGVRVPRLTIRSNLDAVTWMGDLGSLMAAWTLLERTQAMDAHKLDSLVEVYTPAKDNLGNIDGIAIVHLMGNSLNGMKISEILEFYYFNSSLQHQKFQVFSLHLSRYSARQWKDQLSDAAAFYLANAAKNNSQKTLRKMSPQILKLSFSRKSTLLFNALKRTLVPAV